MLRRLLTPTSDGSFFLLLGVLTGVAAWAGCGDSADLEDQRPAPLDDAPTTAPRDDAKFEQIVMLDREAVEAGFSDNTARLEAQTPFRQVGFMFDAPGAGDLEWRRSDSSDARWQPVQVTWSESGAHVGRIFLSRPTRRIELRHTGRLTRLVAEFYPEIVASRQSPEAPSPSDRTSPPQKRGNFRTRRQQEAPRSLVIPREDWGARHPNKKCGRPHMPERMTIHHTANPSDDGGDPAKRMRQMQAFHIDSRGWCDIGYHFVVSQSGKIYQGRSTEKRTGAHVGGENYKNIGISLIGNFQNQSVSTRQFDAATKIVHWVHKTYNVRLNRSKVKGHTEWPGQNTSCPGANLKSRLRELVNKSKNAGPSNGYDVDINVNLRDLDNPYDQGSSASVADSFPGQTFRADIRVTNRSNSAIRDVWLGYAFQSPYVEPTDYTIFTDYPERDQQNWMVNDSDMAPQNPPKDQMGDSGELNLYAFSEGETKRIVVDFKAGPYSIGAIDHPDVRAWVKTIEGVYETQTGWADDVSTNKVGKALRDFDQLDVVSRQQWHFEAADHPKNLEGWTACCGNRYDTLKLDQDDRAMAVEVTGRRAHLRAPTWTQLDAATYDQLVLRMRGHDGAHDVAVWWASEGAEFSPNRALRFRANGDGQFSDYVVPIGEFPNWSGKIHRLRLTPLYDRTPRQGAEARYAVDRIFLQSSSDRETNTSRVDYVTRAPVEAEPLDPAGPDDSPDTGDPTRADTEFDTAPDAAPVPDTGTSPDGGLTNRASASNIQVNEGCSASGRSHPPFGIGAWLVALGFGVLVGRRR